VPTVAGSKRPRISHRRVGVTVACAEKVPGLVVAPTCDGVVQLAARVDGKRRPIGAARFSLPGGATQTVRVRLTAAARAVLPLRAQVIVTVGDETASRRIKVRLPA
jgi:hypothetical protein